MAELPTGTLTFLFTDLERSTGLWEELAIVDRLGTEQGAALQARGASMSSPELVAYLRVEAERVLDES
jgi:hypothetical protein